VIFDDDVFPFSNPSSNIADQGNTGTNWNTSQVLNLFLASPLCAGHSGTDDSHAEPTGSTPESGLT
jgi:hypothetical protein